MNKYATITNPVMGGWGVVWVSVRVRVKVKVRVC